MGKVLIACEFSGVVRDAFIKRGHEAVSCDILPCEPYTIRHIQADVRRYLDRKWDLLIGHPPCTYLRNSGVRWLHELPGRYEAMVNAGEFFARILRAKCPKVAVENPIPHKYAIDVIGRKYDQIIQPWQFGHGETKATCLWLKNLPKLKPTNIVEGREARIHKMPPSKDRGRLRSITYQGIADAMAEQWGGLL